MWYRVWVHRARYAGWQSMTVSSIPSRCTIILKLKTIQISLTARGDGITFCGAAPGDGIALARPISLLDGIPITGQANLD